MSVQTIFLDKPLSQLRRRAFRFLNRRAHQKEEQRLWKYHNTFLGRKVERNEETGDFRIVGGQVQVSL